MRKNKSTQLLTLLKKLIFSKKKIISIQTEEIKKFSSFRQIKNRKKKHEYKWARLITIIQLLTHNWIHIVSNWVRMIVI